MIIYGAGNFNRRNYSLIRKHCAACGVYGYHQSYESSRFFTLYFVPVIPIGSQKIVSECPHCKHAEGLSKRDWKRLRTKELPSMVEAYEADPKNREAAEAVLVTAAHSHSWDSLRRLAPVVRANFPKDAEMEALLASVMSYLCMDDEADQAFLAALELDSGEEIAEQSGRHMQARDSKPPQPKNRLLQSLPVLIVPMVILYFVGSYVVDSLDSSVDEARLVNGLGVPYDVSINGEIYSLKANGALWIDNVQFGSNRIEAVPGSLEFPAADFVVDVPIHHRAYDAPSVVVNPDRTAVVLKESSVYSTTNDGDYNYTLSVGDSFYVYEGIDYFFKEFPDEIDLPSASSRVTKRRVSLLDEYDDLELAQVLLNEGNERVPAYLESKLQWDSNADSLLPYGLALIDAEVFMGIIEEKIDVSPTDVRWHRTYQNTVESTDPTVDLEADYRARLEANPEDVMLMYLYGRVVEDQQESVELFERANTTTADEGFAANALAYHYLLEGDFVAARRYSDAAMNRSPDEAGFIAVRESILKASQDYVALGQVADAGFADYAYDFNSFSLRLLSSVIKDPAVNTTKLIDSFCAELKQDEIYDEAELKEVRYGFLSYAAAIKGGKAAYLDILRGTEFSDDFQQAVLEGRYSDAAAALEISEDVGVYDYLTLYALAKSAGNDSVAAEILSSSVELFNASGADASQWAEWLQQDTAPSLDELTHQCLQLDLHYVVLAAFAQRFPESSRAFNGHAQEIVFQPGFYSLALSGLLAN